MAAMAESGRPSKVQVHTCLNCTNRLSDLCYDKHTLCEKCRNWVCGYNSFCDECRSWSTDFRRMYVKHQRTLHQKRVSKEKAKAKSPPIADDSVSNVSIESHVSVPVVILPLDSQSVDIDDNISNIQNIDNDVEIQHPQPEVPPLPPPWYLTPGLWYQSLIDLIIYFLSLRVVAPHKWIM